MKIKSLSVLLALLLSMHFASSQHIEKQIDAIFAEAYPADSPGATVLIAKDDKVIYRKAFGMANLELNVSMKPENVLELASITKQFTGVAILMLMEQGKLSLKDPLSKYIADYPKGDQVTIHHLLNHTSGIKSYTDGPGLMQLARTDMTPIEIINSFKDSPVDFEPGEQYAYNNSAYILLGYIIEQVSGMSYEDFIQKNIFDKLGMKNSYYGSRSKIIPNRASGYQPSGESYQNAEYLSMTIPYAAGSLMSTVDDMFLWHKAIHHNKLISEKSKQLAFTNYTLNNGKHINYGYGWGTNELAGVATIEHTGGIFGFTTSGIYVPEKNIYAIVLTNDNGKGPETFNLKATAIVLGKPLVEKPAVALTETQLQQWTGAYQFEDVVRYITHKDGALYSTREGGQPFRLIPLSENNFQFEGSFTTYDFSLKNGKKEVLFADRINKSKGIETDKKPEPEKESITLAPEKLTEFEGTYELQPSFHIVVRSENNRLFAQATGQPEFEIFAESENTFFLKIVEAKVTFNKNPDGSIKSLTLFQGGQEMEGKKIK
ncbi:MAG: serine hydrolase [Flavobacteriaceae bacterium]|nr:serine hydrolase [Flavobacteriaceae bacterium]